MRYQKFLILLCLILSITLSCKKNKSNLYPHMLMLPEMKEIVLKRALADVEPYKTKMQNINSIAEREYNPGNPNEWQSKPEEDNASTAQANAFLAYLFDDDTRAKKAIDFLKKIRTDFETNKVYDTNIRIPRSVIPYINALDLLSGTDFITEEEKEEIKARIVEVVDDFFNMYVRGTMAVVHLPTQNNYNIKTASTIAYAAIAFPDAPNQREWWNFSLSELGYMFSKESHYIQEDGGVSEEPFYYGFALSSAVPVFIAYKNTFGNKSAIVSRDCSLRNPVPPWDDVNCIDEEEYEFKNPLDSELFINSLDWTLKLRLPVGDRPPVGDGPFNSTNVISVLSGIYEKPEYVWDAIENEKNPYSTFDDVYFMVYFNDEIPSAPPRWSPTQFFTISGDAVFRSDWTNEAVWLMLKCEKGPVHMTVHDHVDGTSFQLFAFGEYLAIDTGYYKPNNMDNAVTSHFQNHNVILIDNAGPPDKGLLTNFGDTDCYLENIYDSDIFDYAEARMNYQNTDLTRSLLFVRNRYAIIFDDLNSTSSHEYTFRIHGYAGYDSGGIYSDLSLGGKWERTKAGLDSFVISTAGIPIYEHPTYQKYSSPNVHLFENDRIVRDHTVLDAVVSGEDVSFVSVFYPYKVNSTTPSEMPATVNLISSSPGTAVVQINTPDGNKDVCIANRTGNTISITLSDGKVIETDARSAFVGITDSIAFIIRGTYLKVNGQTIPLEGTAETFMRTIP